MPALKTERGALNYQAADGRPPGWMRNNSRGTGIYIVEVHNGRAQSES